MDSSKIKDGFLGQKMIVFPDSIKQELYQNEICKLFYLTEIGFYPNAHNHYRTRKKGAKEDIFIYCVEGKGEIIIQEDKIMVTANSYYIIPRNTPHEYKSSENEPWSIYWIHYNGLSTESLYKRHLDHKNINNSVGYESIRIELFNEIFNICKSHYAIPNLEFASILGLRYLSSFIYSTKELVVANTQNTTLVNSIIEFLTNNLDKAYKSDEIAEQFNCSPSYLFKLFKKRTGYSIMHFFNLKKVQKACEYLKYTELSIKEISFKVGVQDPLYFSRIFKNYFGVSPKKYRREQRE